MSTPISTGDRADARYWMLFGADQLVHQLTYLAIVIAADAGHAQLGLAGSDHSTLRKKDFIRAIRSFSTVAT